MNTIPRLPLPTASYYVDSRWPNILGGGEETAGPFQTSGEARKYARRLLAPYPGSYGPGITIRREER